MSKDFCIQCQEITSGEETCDNCETPFGKLRCYEHNAWMNPIGRTNWGSWKFDCRRGDHFSEVSP